MNIRKAAIAMIAPLMIMGVGTANASEAIIDHTVIDCNVGQFYVGGYRDTNQVPEGFTPITTPKGIFPWESGGYNKGQNFGVEKLVEAVDAYASACPTAPIYIGGYSYGAAIVHTALETIDNRPYANRVTVNVTGNPRHPGGIEDNYSGSASLGIKFRGEGVIPENILGFNSECNKNDGICDLPPMSSDPVGFGSGVVGYFTGAHNY